MSTGRWQVSIIALLVAMVGYTINGSLFWTVVDFFVWSLVEIKKARSDACYSDRALVFIAGREYVYATWFPYPALPLPSASLTY